MSRSYAVIGGGGTGGHVLPALAIGRALVAAGHDPASIHFVGSRRGMERRLVPEAGFEITLLPGRGIARRLTLDNVGAVLGLATAVVQSVILMLRRRPAVAVSVGGYAGLPVALAAIVCRVPLIVVEQNAVPGAANRLTGRFARAAAVSFPGTPLPRAVLTGNPLRPEILALDTSPAGRAAARELLALPADRTVMAAFGGSLGSRTINQATRGLAQLWQDREDMAIHHVVGRRDWPTFAADAPRIPPEKGLVYHAVEYEDRMPQLLAAADLALCRSGGSVAELAAAGLPAILVPLPQAPGDHQTANARAFVDRGAALMVADADCTPTRLAELVASLLAEPGRLPAMAAAAAGLARPDAAAQVAALVEQHARA